MTTVLRMLLVVAMVTIALVNCANKSPTACNKCDWKFSVKIRDEGYSGTDCTVYVSLYFADGTHSPLRELGTSGNDFARGTTQSFTLDISDRIDRVKEYAVFAPSGLCIDAFQPEWTELSNKNRPNQVTGRCNYSAGLWLSKNDGVCCQNDGSSYNTCTFKYELWKA